MAQSRRQICNRRAQPPAVSRNGPRANAHDQHSQLWMTETSRKYEAAFGRNTQPARCHAGSSSHHGPGPDKVQPHLPITTQLPVTTCRMRDANNARASRALDETVSLSTAARRKIARFMSNFTSRDSNRDGGRLFATEGSPTVVGIVFVSSIHSEST